MCVYTTSLRGALARPPGPESVERLRSRFCRCVVASRRGAAAGLALAKPGEGGGGGGGGGREAEEAQLSPPPTPPPRAARRLAHPRPPEAGAAALALFFSRERRCAVDDGVEDAAIWGIG